MSRIDGQRGFSLVETMIGAALLALGAIACCGAIAAATHAASLETKRRLLDDDALAALADVRAITAYDHAMTVRLIGRTATMLRTRRGFEETLTLQVSAGAVPVAQVTAAADGLSVAEQASLYQEAPAPGSIVPQ